MERVHEPHACRFEGARAAFSIIARGPEQIKSQFCVSYGMVLNLLSTRSLADCAVFLDRSFLRFQALGSVGGTIREAEALERQAEALMAQSYEEGSDEAVYKLHDAARVRAACAGRAVGWDGVQGMHGRHELHARGERRGKGVCVWRRDRSCWMLWLCDAEGAGLG